MRSDDSMSMEQTFTVTVVLSNARPTGLPIITGITTQFQTLTVDTSGIADADGPTTLTFTYQWSSEDGPIRGATSTTLYLSAYVSEGIIVTVSYVDRLGNTEILTSARTAAIAFPADVNAAPTISGNPPTTVEQDMPYSFTPMGADADGDNLIYSIENRPTWATFEATTGALTGTPAGADIQDLLQH